MDEMKDKELDIMSKAGESDRVARLKQVIELVELGVTVTKACQKIGYPRSSYYVDRARLESEEDAA